MLSQTLSQGACSTCWCVSCLFCVFYFRSDWTLIYAETVTRANVQILVIVVGHVSHKIASLASGRWGLTSWCWGKFKRFQAYVEDARKRKSIERARTFFTIYRSFSSKDWYSTGGCTGLRYRRRDAAALSFALADSDSQFDLRWLRTHHMGNIIQHNSHITWILMNSRSCVG